jgi:hypothetical protein
MRKGPTPPTEPPSGEQAQCAVADNIRTQNPQQNRTPSWREVLPVHPAAELFPRVSEEELNVLTQDIQRHGLKTKITLWNDGIIDYVLNGITRLDALERVGIKFFATETHDGRCLPDFEYFSCLTDPALDPYAYVISANIHRRHLTAEKKHDLITQVLKARPELSDRQIGKMVRADKNTVAGDRADLEARGEIHHVEKRTDAKGRTQPATKRTAQPSRSPAEEATARAAMQVELDDIAESRRAEPIPSRKAVASKDIALIAFNERVLDLLHRISENRPDRFAKTSVEVDGLAKLGKFFADLARLKAGAAP